MRGTTSESQYFNEMLIKYRELRAIASCQCKYFFFQFHDEEFDFLEHFPFTTLSLILMHDLRPNFQDGLSRQGLDICYLKLIGGKSNPNHVEALN
ncbi:potassium channel subfamily K member 18-like [Sesbania bispinosa]|nr:potassium channel subfamily K member 18-like [Sesbania bispinosa]